jgi:hypothetical protein
VTPPDWAARIGKRIGASPDWALRIDSAAIAFDQGDRSDGACLAVGLREAYFAGAAWAAGVAVEIVDETTPARRARR